MLQQDELDDYVIATGQTHSVKEFIDTAFSYIGFDWQNYVTTQDLLYRPSETYELCGDYRKTRNKFGWEPRLKFSELIKMMVEADLQYFKKKNDL